MSNETDKPSAAALRIAKELEMSHYSPVLASEGILKKAELIDAELSAERKAAEEMAKKLQDVKAACMYHGFSDIPRQIDVVLAAYDAARKGE